MTLAKTTYRLRMTFTEPLLGTRPGSKTPAGDFIREKQAEWAGDDESELEPDLEKGTTGFMRTPDGDPLLLDYMIKGFFSEAALSFNGLRGVGIAERGLERRRAATQEGAAGNCRPLAGLRSGRNRL